MLTCRELAQEQASDYIDHQLTLRQRMGVYLHLLLCEHCRIFIKQFRQLSQILKRRPPESVDEQSIQALAGHLHHLHSQQHSEGMKK